MSKKSYYDQTQTLAVTTFDYNNTNIKCKYTVRNPMTSHLFLKNLTCVLHTFSSADIDGTPSFPDIVKGNVLMFDWHSFLCVCGECKYVYVMKGYV